MEIFLLGAALAFSINIELGVVNVMIVRTAIDRGAWPAFLIGLGSCIGDVIWACAGALGVSALLQWPPAAWVLWLGGSAILCWFAAAALRDAVRGGSIDDSSPLRRATGLRAVGLGLGVKDFRVVFVFSDLGRLREFVEKGWDFSGQADAAAKSDDKGAAVSGAVTVMPGVEVYQLTKNGVALQVTLQGTKYWKVKVLN